MKIFIQKDSKSLSIHFLGITELDIRNHITFISFNREKTLI